MPLNHPPLLSVYACCPKSDARHVGSEIVLAFAGPPRSARRGDVWVLLVRLARTDEVGLDAELTSFCDDVLAVPEARCMGQDGVRLRVGGMCAAAAQAYVVFASLCVRRWAMELSAEGGCCCAERWVSVRRASYSADVLDNHDRLLPNYAICKQYRGRVGAVFASAGVQR
jgi:hypothetical protein